MRRNRAVSFESFLSMSWRLKAAMREPGCPVCQRAAESESNFFFWLLTQQYYVPGFMDRVKDSFGFCRAHSDVLRGLGSPYVTSVMYEYLVEDTRRRIEEFLARLAGEPPGDSPARRRRKRPGLRRGPLERKRSCPACENRARTETEELKRLVEGYERFPQWRALFEASDGLCLDHFLQSGEWASPGVLRRLAELQVGRLKGLGEELREYLRKCSWTYRDEPKGDEQTAWRRAIEHYAGSFPADVASGVAKKFRHGLDFGA